jgi:hypothetical protein
MDNGNEWTSKHISKNENILYLKKECSFNSAASLSPEPSLSLGSLIRSRPRRFFASCEYTQEGRGGEGYGVMKGKYVTQVMGGNMLKIIIIV